MEIKKKTLVIGVLSLLFVGIVLVSASTYYSTVALHKAMMHSEDFAAMHEAMIKGDYATAEQYHAATGVDCPLHALVKEGKISPQEMQAMYDWMMSGSFPQEKPATLSDEPYP